MSTWENDKKTKTDDRDDFWNLDRMLPRREFQASEMVYDTEAVDITFGKDGGEGMREFAKTGNRIPPMPNITTRGERRAGGHLAARAHTPGDVLPQMSVPVSNYTPKDSFLKEVSVYRWPTRYQYYERFSADALRYFDRTAEKCPFANFFAYMPQYAAMSQDQLRWYLYWRENVRAEQYLQTDYSYLFLYVYEIINLPEKIKPEVGLDLLCKLWLAYRTDFPRLDRYMGEWVCDYCLVYALTPPFETLKNIIPSLVDKLSFKEFYIRADSRDACPFTASLCDLLSNYNWRQSKYAKGETYTLYEEHLYGAVLDTLRTAWRESEREELSSILGLSEVKLSRNAFSGALCTYNCKRRIDVTYISLSRSYQLRFLITDLYKMAENCIRAHLGIKSRLSAMGVPPSLKATMLAYFEEHLPRPLPQKKETKAPRKRALPVQKEAEPSPYEALYEPLSTTLSTEDAMKLEESSWVNTVLLVPIEEEQKPLSKAPPTSQTTVMAEDQTTASQTADPPMGDDPFENFVAHLNPIYYAALKHLICMENDEFLTLCQTNGLLPDAVCDAINDIAVTYTDDTVLEGSATGWQVSSYYANEVMAAIVAKEETT